MERFYCEIWEQLINETQCHFKKEPSGYSENKYCQRCPKHEDIQPFPHSCPPPKRTRKQGHQGHKEDLEKWVNTYWSSLPIETPREDVFYKGSFKKIQKIIGVKNPDETFIEQLSSYTFRFVELIDFEIRTAPTRKQIQHEIQKLKFPESRLPSAGRIRMLMGGVGSFGSWASVPINARKSLHELRTMDLSKCSDEIKDLLGLDTPSSYDRKTLYRMLRRRIESLPERKVLNRPLYVYVFLLAIFYEKWTGREVKRLNKNKQYKINKKFYDFVSYLIRSLGLSKVWGPGSINKAIQRVIKTYLLPLRACLKRNYPSRSLGEIDPSRLGTLPENLIKISFTGVEKTLDHLFSIPSTNPLPLSFFLSKVI